MCQGLRAQKSSVQFQEMWLSSDGASCLMWLQGSPGDQGTHLGGWVEVEGLGLLFGTWWRRRRRAQPQAPPQRLCPHQGQRLHRPHKILLANPLLGVQRGWVFGESVLHGACGPGVWRPGGRPRGLQRR